MSISKKRTASARGDTRIPKLCGGDIEVGNFLLGAEPVDPRGTGPEAASALLREIHGIAPDTHYPGGSYASASATALTPATSEGWHQVGSGYNPQDWGRRWLRTNGGCVYIDLNHLELCMPEVLSATQFVGSWQSMLQIGQQALQDANAKLSQGRRLQVLINNSDGLGQSYGSHLNVLMSRSTWDGMFSKNLLHLLWLASFQVSSVVITGQGKVGTENGTPYVPFQLSQRADFFETLVGEQTTYHRPLVNMRDEALCGEKAPGNGHRLDDHLARLHSIFFDSTLCQTATFLKVGMMQLILAMIEGNHVNINLIVKDPLLAVKQWSCDPSLQSQVELVSGKSVTALELQFLFLEEVMAVSQKEGFDEIVPEANEILSLWEDTLMKLRERNTAALVRRLDWVLKLSLLQRIQEQRPDLSWSSPEMKHLDFAYCNLDPAEGLYWPLLKAGLVDIRVSPAGVQHCVDQPPDNTRAWARAMVLRQIDGVNHYALTIDWDHLEWISRSPRSYSRRFRIAFPNPLGFTKSDSEKWIHTIMTNGPTSD